MKFKIKKSNFHLVSNLIYIISLPILIYFFFDIYYIGLNKIVFVFSALLLFIPLPDCFFKNYTLNDNFLKIGIGIRYKKINIDNIISFKKCSKTFAPLGTDFSYHKEKLRVDFYDKKGYKREVYLSPENRDEFAKKLRLMKKCK